MAEQELDLVQFAAREVAQTGASAPQVVRGQLVDPGASRGGADNVPQHLGRPAVSPDTPVLVDCPEHRAVCDGRRGRLLALRLDSIQQREEHWVIADLVGKGGHVRTVPIPRWVKSTTLLRGQPVSETNADPPHPLDPTDTGRQFGTQCARSRRVGQQGRGQKAERYAFCLVP